MLLAPWYLPLAAEALPSGLPADLARLPSPGAAIAAAGRAVPHYWSIGRRREAFLDRICLSPDQHNGLVARRRNENNYRLRTHPL